jgi:hypothetical protein
MDAIDACPPLEERVDKRILPREEKIACVLKLEKRPTKAKRTNVVYNGAAYPFSIRTFAQKALQRAGRGEGDDELLQLPWFVAALAKLPVGLGTVRPSAAARATAA